MRTFLLMALGLFFSASAAHALENFSCQAMANEQGCGYGMAIQFDGVGLISYFELQRVCADDPDRPQTLVTTSGIYATPNFRPRDPRYYGWSQFLVEGLTTGQRASLLAAPRCPGDPLQADLRLVTPGAPASTVMQLTCEITEQ